MLAQALRRGEAPKGMPRDVAKRAVTKLFMLDTVTRLTDLRVPPGNSAGGAFGRPRGRHSIASTTSGASVSVWRDGDAYDVELVDYH